MIARSLSPLVRGQTTLVGFSVGFSVPCFSPGTKGRTFAMGDRQQPAGTPETVRRLAF